MAIDLTIGADNIDSDYKRISFDLLNKWVIKFGTYRYRICEIEFYLKSETHNDAYTHGHPLQKEKGRWYFHPSGVDITFGSDGSYGGILIRALYNIDNGDYIYGPLNCVTELFSNIENIYETKLSFGLIPVDQSDVKIENPIAAPRVGLNPLKDIDKHKALYRYLIMPKRKHAEKTIIVESMLQQGYPADEINNIWG